MVIDSNDKNKCSKGDMKQMRKIKEMGRKSIKKTNSYI